MEKSEKHVVFQGQTSSLLVDAGGDAPRIAYWGPKLEEAEITRVGSLLQRTPATGTPSVEVPISLCPTLASGFVGMPGIELHIAGKAWDFAPTDIDVTSVSDSHCRISTVDPHLGISLAVELEWFDECDVVRIRHHLKNIGDEVLTLNWIASAAVEVPSDFDQVTSFSGKWAHEFQRERTQLATGAFVRENRRGRTSHASFPGLVLEQQCTTEQAGSAYGFHLGWSGNHRLFAEKLNDGRIQVQMGASLFPGEMLLGAGQSHQTPWLYGSFSSNGLSALSQNFHDFVRHNLIRGRARTKPRPVHYNTWEAIYFNHNPTRIMDLASKAAAVGVERFVLDDGWFMGRRGDAAGLGDWQVDPDIYPEGLTPIIEHVNSLGMEFGLWVEPEMVNPDSDLYRAHPDWVLKSDHVAQIPSRNQYVLDLTKPPVFDYLFECIDTLLQENNISYLKWDMNRDIHHPGSDGLAVTYKQTLAVYDLMAKVRSVHPDVEIESCSSGGARADYGVLAHTDRIWTSDSNDALDRQSIQAGASMFFPLQVLGAHVGPRDCHITGRHLSMQLRVATAIFGHMGMELDLSELSPDEETTLKRGVALYKKHRGLLHSGNFVRVEAAPYANACGVVAKDQTEALFSYAMVASRASASPEVLKLPGLSDMASYRFELAWPLDDDRVTIGEWQHLKGQTYSGRMLSQVGVQLPPILPESALIIHLKAV
ncbi:MAG: alpha-galactosidase [Kordiimonadaceae bacterium]|nr:alpha-galactosidase [Kordiimonadaceae bacterium]MBO6569849.1 alpha-galactosidase [Kordiimonadaceae bacterium]MBO6966055.1 alpha-galactosidase [Kordiimonadaceae bacterium]